MEPNQHVIEGAAGAAPAATSDTELVAETLRATRLPPECLELEITESAVMQDGKKAALMLAMGAPASMPPRSTAKCGWLSPLRVQPSPQMQPLPSARRMNDHKDT